MKEGTGKRGHFYTQEMNNEGKEKESKI